jgi:hypothetical protein
MGIVKIEGKEVTLDDDVIRAGEEAVRQVLSASGFPAASVAKVKIDKPSKPGAPSIVTVSPRSTGKGASPAGAGPIRVELKDWLAKAESLFGEDRFRWRFVCPGCGHVQAVEDFRPYKSSGAHEGSAYQECIGRYLTSGGPYKWGNTSPCDYAGYGLFRISPVIVITNEGKEIYVFAFDESPVKEAASA